MINWYHMFGSKTGVQIQCLGTISSISHLLQHFGFPQKKIGLSLTQQTPNSQVCGKQFKTKQFIRAFRYKKKNEVLLDVSEYQETLWRKQLRYFMMETYLHQGDLNIFIKWLYLKGDNLKITQC